MKKTWFPQLIAAFVLAALAGLYLVPRTLSAEEMNQIVGACDCTWHKEIDCLPQSYTTDNDCYNDKPERGSCRGSYNNTKSCKKKNSLCRLYEDCYPGQKDEECK